jgi:hypothetical protein
VTGFRSRQCCFNRFVITHFTDEYDIGILAQCATKSFRERTCIDVDFALRHKRMLVAMQKLDWIFDGDDVTTAGGVDAVDHRRERRRFAGTGCARDEDQATTFLGNRIDYAWQTKLRGCLRVIGNDAEHDADSAALLKNVCPEATQPGDAITDIDFRNLFEALLLPVGHHRESHVQRVFRLQPRSVSDGVEFAADTHHGERSHLQVKVGRILSGRNSK